jgi:PKD repeat protein
VAVASATPQLGPVPLTVTFSSAGTSDPNEDPLTYAWDLDGDGGFDDSFVANPVHTYTVAGTFQARLQVSDGHGGIDLSDLLTIQATATANNPPVASIVSPSSSLTWDVGQTISLQATATDESSNLVYTWTATIVHCSSTIPDDCHEHVEATFTGASVSYVAPDHEYPSRLRFDLVVTDPQGLTDNESVEILARPVVITLATTPTGMQTTIGGLVGTSLTVIANSQQTISAVTPQLRGRTTYVFRTWQDGVTSATRIVTVPNSVTYTAIFNAVPTARVTASPKNGSVGATLTFTATGTDVDGTVSFAWDLDNDGQFDDGTGASQSITFNTAGTYIIKVRVTDNFGATADAQVSVKIGGGRGFALS